MSIFTVIHTNDLHGSLTQSLAKKLTALKLSAGPSSVLVDAGDAISAGNVDFRPWPEPVLLQMNNAGYDAMALGNREYHFRRLVMRQKIGAALFPVLAANVVRARGADTTPLPVGSVAMKRLSSGLKVAFIGVTVPWVTREHWWRFIADTLVEDPVNTALSLATKIRPSVDIVIVLTHIGIDRDRELASRAGSLVDLIVGGHSHTPLVEPDVSCGTPIVQAGDHGRSIGIVKLEIENGATARLLAGELIPCEAPD